MMTRLVVRLRAARSQLAGTTTALMREFCGLDARFATFAGGCFWGLELALQRTTPGVLCTAAGYTQELSRCLRVLDDVDVRCCEVTSSLLLVLWDCVFIVSCDGASVITDMKMRLLEDALIQPEAPHFTGKVFISTPVHNHILNAASARMLRVSYGVM